MVKTYYTDLEEAKEAVRLGNAWGAIYISENFTDAFTARAALGKIIIKNYSSISLIF